MSSEALYNETGWETLKTRQYVVEMTNMIKIHKGEYPNVPKIREHVLLYLY